MLVSDSIPSLINGVSQQPPTLRLPSQVSALSNGYPSEVEGLVARPPLTYLATLSAGALDNTFAHSFSDSDGVGYVALFSTSGVRVFRLEDGFEINVVNTAGLSYLSLPFGDAVGASYRCLTVADYTFFANRSKVTALGAARTPQRPKEALVVVKQGAYGKTYKVHLRRTGSSLGFWRFYATPDGGDASHSTYVGTDYIAEQLRLALATPVPPDDDPYGTPLAPSDDGFVITRLGSVLHISHPTDDFEIKVEDDFNQNGATAIKGVVTRFSSLPNVAPDGFHLEVVGDETTAFDNFYVRFEAVPGSSVGVWREAVQQDIVYQFDAATMPHVLVRQADGHFTFKQATWGEREVGDPKSATAPSFVGHPIVELLLYRGRLGLVAKGGSMVLSQASDQFNFWPTTVTQVLDDAPIDESGTDAGADIHAVIPFAGRLILWSAKRQLALTTGDLLTPRSYAIDTITNFSVDTATRPVVAGIGAYFTKTVGQHSRLYELTLQDDGIRFDADDVTSRAPNYYPKNITGLSASNTHGLIVMVSPDAPSSLFLYKSYRNNGELVQSAPFRWDFPASFRIISASFERDELLMVWSQAGQGTFLGSFTLEAGATDPDADYLTRLDRRVHEGITQITATYHAAAGGLPARTRISLPYVASERTALVTRVDAADPEYVPGLVPAVVQRGSNWIEFEGDWTPGRKYWIGDTYDFRTELSQVQMRKQGAGGGSAPIIGGRLQLRYITVNHSGTGPFVVRVAPSRRQARDHVSSGRQLGASAIGAVPVLESGQFRFPIMCRNTDVVIEIISTTHLPAKFQSLEWEGFYTNRDRSL